MKTIAAILAGASVMLVLAAVSPATVAVAGGIGTATLVLGVAG